jgi:hypothetical protein
MKTRRPKPLLPGMPESRVLAGTIEGFALFGVEAKRRNVAGFTNPKGRYVACGEPGDSDVYGTFPAHFGPAAGKSFAVETKKGDFNPIKVRGKERDRFLGQVAKLKAMNDAGGYGWWLVDPASVPRVLQRIKEGWRIVFDENNIPWLEK